MDTMYIYEKVCLVIVENTRVGWSPSKVVIMNSSFYSQRHVQMHHVLLVSDR
jgi:hypothetical protein